MTRNRWRPPVAVGLVAALLAYVGCSSPKHGEPAVTGPKPTAQEAAPSHVAPSQEKAKAEAAKEPIPRQKLFTDWPAPAAAILVSGEQFGYLEPCGCTQGQLGGLIRRYELARKLQTERRWPLVRVDLGSLVKDPAAARGGQEQTRLKFDAALKALAAMDYDALALSPEDLKLGISEVVGRFLNIPGDRLKVVAANVSSEVLNGRLVPSVRVQAGPVKVGVTAVVDPESIKALRDDALDMLTVKPIGETLPAVLADLEKDTQTQILMVQAAPELAKALAAKYPGFEVVVATSDVADPNDDAERLNGGKTLLVSVGHKGKYVGVVGLFPGGRPADRFQLVRLDPHFDATSNPVKTIIENEFRGTLKAQGIVQNFPRHDFVNAPKGARFVGAENCKFCHPKTFDKWESTGHADAFASLERDPKPNVIHDAECVSCHTTGFEYTSGWKSPKTSEFLNGNQCENCHGPASKHVADPDNKAFLAPMHLTAEQADRNRQCLTCHDEDNSPHFKFEEYWPKIDHKGLDDYKNPEVHKGRPAVVARKDGT